MTGEMGVVTPRLAATLMLLRDGPSGIEVLMMVRHERSSFVGGAMVFPGGKVDAADGEIAARVSPGGSANDHWALTLKVAAVRETFEECGILLARRAGSSSVLTREQLAALPASDDFAALLDAHELEPAIDLLVPFANWITPVMSPKRFDTHFFLAKAATDQLARHDGHEAVEVMWTTPAATIADADAKRRSLIPPTYLNLKKLLRHDTVDTVLDAAREQTIVPVTPQLVRGEAGPELVIPEAAGYGVTRYPAPAFLVR